jgi:hypothetical protein
LAARIPGEKSESTGRPAMQNSPEYAFNPSASTEIGLQKPARAANIAYQSVTIAAMILLLGSLWVF